MKQFIVKEIPKSNLEISNFELQEVDIPKPSSDEILVKNILLSIDAANRTWMQGRTYRDQVFAGDVMPSYSIAEVVESNHPDFKVGQIVTSDSYWEEFSLVKAKDVNKCPQNVPLSYLLSIFGIAGLTAYHGLFDVGRLVASDTVVISAAAGSVGIYAGQLAKAMGCKVIGIAGNDKKCKEVVDSLGFDGCINYKTGNLLKELKEHCPEGISLYFDNVGGPILEYALGNIAQKARVVMCGGISSGYTMERLAAGPSTIFNLIIQRGKMEGFIVIDYAEQFPNAIMELAGWVAEGKITYKEDIAEGLENCPETLANLFKGKNFGKQLLKLSD